MARKTVEQALKFNDGRIFCCYCGVPMFDKENVEITIEHIVPLSKGGANCKQNKKPCCSGCNSMRGNQDYGLWIERLKKKKKRLNASLLDTTTRKHRIDMMIENITYWQLYVEKMGTVLYKTQ